MSKRALIFGIGGMDGSYLAEILIDNGYQVFGTTRKSSVDNLVRISHIRNKIHGIYRCDLTDALSVHRAIVNTKPTEIYNEADQDNVGWSHSIPGYSIDTTIKGVSNILEVVRVYAPECKVFLPTSATIFGDASSPQDEETKLNPLSPYACAKASVLHLARYYRQVHGLWVSTGILYNHDSNRRGKGYLLQSIYNQVCEVERESSNKIIVGSLEQVVDIGYAREYMEGAYAMMQMKLPTDMILATGIGYTIGAIVRRYLDYYGVTREVEIVNDPDFQHDKFSTELIGNTTKAKKLIGWYPKFDAMNMIEILDSVYK